MGFHCVFCAWKSRRLCRHRPTVFSSPLVLLTIKPLLLRSLLPTANYSHWSCFCCAFPLTPHKRQMTHYNLAAPHTEGRRVWVFLQETCFKCQLGDDHFLSRLSVLVVCLVLVLLCARIDSPSLSSIPLLPPFCFLRVDVLLTLVGHMAHAI